MPAKTFADDLAMGDAVQGDDIPHCGHETRLRPASGAMHAAVADADLVDEPEARKHDRVFK